MPCVLPDSPGPAAHKPLPPSAPPVARSPFPDCDPGTAPPDHPASHPVLLNNAPVDSPAGSVLHSSTAPLQKLPPPHPASAPPALRTTPARTSPSDTPPPSRSTHTEFDSIPIPAKHQASAPP